MKDKGLALSSNNQTHLDLLPLLMNVDIKRRWRPAKTLFSASAYVILKANQKCINIFLIILLLYPGAACAIFND